MPSRAATIDSADFRDGGLRSLLGRALGRRPLDIFGIVLLTAGAGAILINALYRQPGPHPAPIFAVKQRPVAVEPAEIVPPMPRTRPAAAAAPAATATTPAPVTARPEAQPRAETSDVPMPPQRPARAPARPDPIGELIAGPSPRVTAVQRALNDFGYGPVKATGLHGTETVAAIQKFERDRKMPITGQVSPRLLAELSKLTGKPVE